MATTETKKLCKEFVESIKADNKPQALNLFSKIINNKINDQIEEKKNLILKQYKF